MTTPAKLNEFNAAEDPARRLLERLGWTYVHRDALAAERGNERDVLLRARLRGALLRLNPWLSDSQADSVIGALERLNATGMARNQAVHEYLTYGMPLDDRSGGSRRTRTVRFFDFDNPQSGLNEFVVTTQFRVRRGAASARLVNLEDDERHGHPGPGALRQRHPACRDGGPSRPHSGRSGRPRPSGSCGATRRRGRSGRGPAHQSSSTTT